MVILLFIWEDKTVWLFCNSVLVHYIENAAVHLQPALYLWYF